MGVRDRQQDERKSEMKITIRKMIKSKIEE
jgi:hypothetical protein